MDINFQSIFDTAVEEEKAFDTIFGGEEDDEIMSVVLGEDVEDIVFGEEAEDMNTIDDKESVKDLEKDVVGKEIEAPKCEPSENVTQPEDIDSEKDTPGEQIACPVAGVADAVEKKEPDEENIEEEIDKSEKKVDIEEAFLASILGEDTEVEIDYDTAPATDNGEASDEGEPVPEDEGCHKEGEGCEDGECEKKEEPEDIAPDASAEEPEAPVVYDGETTPDENLDDTFSDEGEDDDDDDDDDVVDDSCKKEGVEEIEDNQTPELDDNANVNTDSSLDGEPGLEGESELPGDVGLESANLDDVFAEEAVDGEEKSEKVEDELIKAAEDESELTDAEVESLVGEEEDDELLDAVLGQ